MGRPILKNAVQRDVELLVDRPVQVGNVNSNRKIDQAFVVVQVLQAGGNQTGRRIVVGVCEGKEDVVSEFGHGRVRKSVPTRLAWERGGVIGRWVLNPLGG